MGNDTTLIVISGCAIFTIIVLLAALVLIRIARFSIFGVSNLVLKSVLDPPEEHTQVDDVLSAQGTPARRDLRAEAKAMDFDAAVARQRGEETASIRTTPGTSMPNPLGTADSMSQAADERAQLRERRRMRRKAEDEDGDMFEGLMGE